MPRFNRLSLSLASTAAVALASLPLGITPANAAKVSQESTSSMGVMEASTKAQQFNLGNLGVQGSSTGLVARGRNDGGAAVNKVVAPVGGITSAVSGFLGQLRELLGFYSPSYSDPTWLLHKT